MKAYEIKEFGIDKLALVERPQPEPAEHEVLVRFRAASLNYRDVMVVSGTYNPRMALPAVPFSDGAGEVEAVGAGVTRWRVGDRVIPLPAQGWFDGGLTDEKRRTTLGAGAKWDGTLREFGTFAEGAVVSVPDHLSFEEAATLPCAALTAWHALAVSGGLKAGETVLTLGTGGVSIFAIQFAKMFGARGIATSSSATKIEKLAGLGVSDAVNYKERSDWDRAVLEITGKRGVDHVVEVGGAGTLSRSINAVRMGGHIAVIGALAAGSEVDVIKIFMKGLRLQGIYTGSREMFVAMNQAIVENRLVPVIDRKFGFGEVREALHYMESGAHFGKIVVTIGD